MPGIATHFQVLDLTVDALSDAGLTSIAGTIKGNPWAYLGVIGPALMDFISSDPPPPGGTQSNKYAQIWQEIFTVVGGDPGLITTLAKIQSLIGELQTLANNEDCHGLENFRDSGQMDAVQTLSTQFANLLGEVDNIAGDVFNLITNDLRPVFCGLDPSTPAPPPTQWNPRDFFSWKKTAKFAQALIARGKSIPDDRLLAYGYGWLVAYVVSITGSPFVNSIVGGPPRTQWWRQRFVKNFVDAWVYGFYNTPGGVSMGGDTGDTPKPPYDQWSSLCSANLHTKIELPGWNLDPVQFLNSLTQPFPQVVPADFAANWALAVGDAYGAEVPPAVTPAGLNSAVLMTWLVLWFQTSGVPIGCNVQPPAAPPGGCTGNPPETDPFNFPPGQSPPGPPIPQPDVSTSTGDVVCGVILAILGGIAILCGDAAAGAGAIAEAAHLLDCSGNTTVDWQDWKCKIFWFQQYMFNGLAGLQNMLSLCAFTYPEARALGNSSNVLPPPFPVPPFDQSILLVKSNREGRDQPFPSKCWDTSNALTAFTTFNQDPTATAPGFETPNTIAYIAGWKYPSWFINDPDNPLSTGDVKTNGGTQLRYDPPASATPFGNAVACAVDLFQNLSKTFPNWNLDADRGIAYYNWQFKSGYDPDDVVIVPEK